MAKADPSSGEAADPSATRRCLRCGEAVAEGLRYCESCGRFAPGGRRPHAWIATAMGVVFWLFLIVLIYVGYLLVPILGFMAEAALWGYVILYGDIEVSGRRVLIGTGIGLVLLAIAAVVIRICGVGA